MTFLLLAVMGLVAGGLSGAFGIGGGVLIVPALVYGLGYSQKLATGTSLAVLLPPIGIAAVFEYYRSGSVDLKAAAIIALTMVFGSWISARWAVKASSETLKLAFGVFLVLLGTYMMIEVLKKPGGAA